MFAERVAEVRHIRARRPEMVAQAAAKRKRASAFPGRLVLIAADPLPQDADRVAATLAQADLGSTESWSFTDRFYERLRYEIDPAWAGELPRTVMIDGDGKITVLPGVADLARVQAWLDAQPKPRP